MKDDVYTGIEIGGVQVDFRSKGCRKILSKNAELAEKIARALVRQSENGFYHAKSASRKKWNGQTPLEIRVNDPSLGALRVAFVSTMPTITVLFLSTTLLKKAFSAELDSFLKEGSA